MALGYSRAVSSQLSDTQRAKSKDLGVVGVDDTPGHGSGRPLERAGSMRRIYGGEKTPGDRRHRRVPSPRKWHKW